MADAAKLLFFTASIAVGWYVYQLSPTWSRRAWYVLSGAPFGLLLTIILAGLFHRLHPLEKWHLWASHALVILLWNTIPISVGMVAARWIRERPAFAIGQIVLLLGSFGLAVLASMTGYLGPSYGQSAAETLARFRVLHQVVLPVTLAGMLAWPLFLFRAPKIAS